MKKYYFTGLHHRWRCSVRAACGTPQIQKVDNADENTLRIYEISSRTSTYMQAKQARCKDQEAS